LSEQSQRSLLALTNTYELIRWCQAQGADPRLVAPVATAFSVGLPPSPPGKDWAKYEDSGTVWWHYDSSLGKFWCDDDTKYTVRSYSGQERLGVQAVCHAGHSAISLALSIKERLSGGSRSEKALTSFVDDLLAVYAQADMTGPQSVVSSGTVDTWLAVMLDMEATDMEIQLEGDHGGSIRAHSLVLRHASPVLKAALSLPMQEQQSRVVKVSDVTQPSLKYLLTLMYVGHCDEEPAAEVQLEAADLAHRWQARDLVDYLDRALAMQFQEDSFDAGEDNDFHKIALLNQALEAAELKQLSRLRSAILQLLSGNRDLKARLQQVASFHTLRCLSPPRKRRRH